MTKAILGIAAGLSFAMLICMLGGIPVLPLIIAGPVMTIMAFIVSFTERPA